MKKIPEILAFAASLREISYTERILKTAIKDAENAFSSKMKIRYMEKF